jgi:uncharacterized linocin/CFP29 family protein
MNHLLRDLAPVTDDAWAAIDEEGRETLKEILAARKLVDFTGPLGWQAYAVDLGITRNLRSGPAAGIQARQRQAQPLVEFRVPFEVPRDKIEAVARGAQQVMFDEVVDAARKIGLAEDKAIFHGYDGASITGIMSGSDHKALTLSADYEKYPAAVAEAMTMLREDGIGGPYAIALGPRCYKGLMTTTTKGGYPVMRHVQELLDGPLVWAPGIDGACVMSTRGGDYELIVGQDFSVGFLSASDDKVRLYIEESFTFRNLEPGAAVALRYGRARATS